MHKRKAKRKKRRTNETALVLSGRAVGSIAVASAFFAVTTFWSANDLSAQRIGAEIDRAFSQAESFLSREHSSGT